MSIKNTIIKTLFIKLYELKNLLILKRVSKLIGIRPLNDVAIIEVSIKKGISLDLPEIDDIDSLELTILEAPKPLKPLELPASKPFKSPEPENKPSKLMLKPFEESIKLIDFSDPDKM